MRLARVLSRAPLLRLTSSATLRCFPLRHLSSAAAQSCPWEVLGLPPGSEKRTIKDRFYELAKETHPDVVKVEPGAEASAETPSFIDILQAFESLMDGSASSSGSSGTASGAASRPSRSARGFGGGGGFGFRSGAGGTRVEREPTLGEVLCARLHEEPEAALEVWADIKARGLEVCERTSTVLAASAHRPPACLLARCRSCAHAYHGANCVWCAHARCARRCWRRSSGRAAAPVGQKRPSSSSK